MKIDHSEFIARYHRILKPEEKQKINRKRAAISILLVLIYLGACTVAAILLEIQREAIIAAGLAFIAASAISYYVNKSFHLRSAQDKERDLIKEVLEGSRGERIITDDNDHCIYANDKFKALCAEFGEPTLENFSRLFENNAETLSHFRLLADQAYRGLIDSIELHCTSGGRDIWYQITVQPVAGWEGYIHWRIDDISRKLEADRAIHDEREKLIDFTDNAPVGFFSVDEKGRFVFVNATLARWLGEDIHTILREGRLHTYFESVPENARPYDIIPHGGAKQMSETVMKGPGGKTFTASISQAVVNEGNGTVRTRGVVHDLTAERAMRQALQASEDRFHRFYEDAPLGIAMLNSQGALDDCNPALAFMLGYEVAEMEGRQFEALIKDDDRERALAALRTMDKELPGSKPMEIVLLGKEKEFAVQMYARKLAGSDNLVLHFIDLTQQKELEAQFVQSQKMQAIGQLAGGIAHDFNNLLTAIIGFCDLLLLRHKPGDSSFSDIMQIKQNSNRAANLVRQLLAFSRQQTLRPKVQDLSDILTELSHLMRRLIGANIELDLIHGADIGLVKVDVGQMEQVLINLAVNARDAMEEGGKLTIVTGSFENKKPIEKGSDTMPPGQWVTLEISDTGCGIPPENFSRIFEPFFTTKEVGSGTGLGLATVYGIIRQTGGYLDVQSKVGKGTVFTIYLPRLSESEAEDVIEKPEEEDLARDLTGTARILLVEDEDAVRTFSSRALSNKGYEMLEADSGEAALGLLDKEDSPDIDLLVTDVIMPNMDGSTLAGKIRERKPDLKIIYISGYTEEKLKEHLGKNIWFLPKPFTLKQLAAKVKEALEE
ncbi:MAG: PAS domain-containing sensor histidine kinase [Alphaproteobacteria bacterium CG_4_9_14_3_um_filter_47_13]|nr:MAG: PAS domain-containing sensor histidine kinase [Alphaproteobacteria bacterium CG_4_9_14_3_um_filter_47_13]